MGKIIGSRKRHRQSQKRRARNTAVRTTVKSAVKKAREAIAAKDPALAKEAFRLATKTINKAASKGVVHARNASRRIARLAKSLNSVGKAKS